MKILYVPGIAETKDIVEELKLLHYTVDAYPEAQNMNGVDEGKIAGIVEYVKEHEITHIISIGLIYNCAIAAEVGGIKYVAIIWDSPYVKMYTSYGRMEMCYYSVFDKLDYQEFKRRGTPHVIYQPCAVRKSEIMKWYKRNQPGKRFVEDISFVGSIYDHNPYDKVARLFPPEIHSYFAEIFEEAAFKWDGVNRVYGKTSPEVLKYMQVINPEFKLDNPYEISDEKFFEIVYLTRKIANIERICILNMLAEYYDVAFFTNRGENNQALAGVKIMPPVQTGEASSFVYSHSKINLNISIKGIEGATPQRVMEITGAGGFTLTNYCEETLELFEEDKEIVTYKSPEEMLDKVEYYLRHEEERKAIARAGYEKTLKCYTYDKKLKQLMDWVEGDNSENN